MSSDRGFQRLWGTRRGAQTPSGSTPQADRQDESYLDALRDAVAALESAGQPLSSEDRIKLCDHGHVHEALAEHGVEDGDGYYIEAFGGTFGPADGASGEVRPLWHHLRPKGAPALGSVFLYYSPEEAAGVFAELWVRDERSAS